LAILLLLASDESSNGSPVIRAGLAQAEAKYPGVSRKISDLRSLMVRSTGRAPRAGFLDFGEAFWVDIGLHTTLRRCLEALTAEDSTGQAMRAFFDIPEDRDKNGNIVLGSSIPEDARIRGSVIINSTIRDPASVVERGVVVGCRHDRLAMPSGGASLFSAVRNLQFDGENGIAFRSIGDILNIPAGGRHTTLFLNRGAVPLVSNESIRAYDDSEYRQRVLGNSLSFEEAGKLVEAIDPHELERRWKTAWQATG